MCGIVAIVGQEKFDEKRSEGERRAQGQKMLQAIQHRGPDGQGLWWSDHVLLGHCRLGITGNHLSGAQPQVFPGTDWAVSYNGEIYNYRQLYKMLCGLGHQFTQNENEISDSEVLSRALQQWEEKALGQLQGMFAFVAYNIKQKKILLARDTLGIKPLYYSWYQKSYLLLGSEAKAISAVRPLSLNSEILDEYFLFGMATEKNTFFREIKSFPPGHYLWQEVLTLKPDHWHPLPFTLKSEEAVPVEHINSDQYYKNLFEESILSHSFNHNSIGIMLSGGLDSSFIANTLAKNNKIFKTFSLKIDCPINDESQYQQMVLKKIGQSAKNHISLECNGDIFYQLLPRCIDLFDSPPFHLGSVLLNGLYQEAQKQNIKVLLTGEGADELLAGYARYTFTKKQLIQSLKRQELHYPRSTFNRLECYYPVFRRLYLMPSRLKNLLPQFNANLNHRQNSFFTPKSLHQSLLNFDQQHYLPALLNRQDKMSMGASVECRVPFCTPQLFSVFNQLSIDEKLKNKTPKAILKRIMMEEFGPEFVLRKKKGLGLPIYQWLNQSSAKELLRYLEKENMALPEIYNHQAIVAEKNRMKKGDTTSTQYLMRIIMFEMWLQNQQSKNSIALS